MAQAEEAALEAACNHYFDTFFVGRNAAASAALASPRITGFGTGVDESVYGIDAALHLYQRDTEQQPSPVHYTLHRLKAVPLGADSGLVMGEMDWHLRIDDQSVTLRQIRFTLVFCREEGQWRVIHKHMSQPSAAHEEGEAYPLKEVEARTVVLKRLVDRRTEELEAARREMQRLATTDALTGLRNRYHTDQVLRDALQRQHRRHTGLTVVLMDVDRFKPINDECGHHVGDQVLIDMARVLEARARSTDVLGRWGGEEFLLVCPDTDLAQGAVLAEVLRGLIAEHTFPVDRAVTISFGVAAYQPGEPLHALLERADRALYRAKHQGRDQVVIADNGPDAGSPDNRIE